MAGRSGCRLDFDRVGCGHHPGPGDRVTSGCVPKYVPDSTELSHARSVYLRVEQAQIALNPAPRANSQSGNPGSNPGSGIPGIPGLASFSNTGMA
jgi:hypothetical protein